MSSTIVVGYWGIRGLGAPLRMMVMYSGNDLQCENYDLLDNEGGYDASAWFQKKPTLKLENPLINLPYVIDNGVVISQSNACFSYLGRKFGMMGSNEILCEQLLCECMDLRNTVTDFVYKKVNLTPEQFLAAVINKNGHLAKLDLWKSTKSTSPSFFIGDSVCAADFHIWEMLDQIRSCAQFFKQMDILADFPSLARFHHTFAALPQNEKYFASVLSKLPQNNLMAIYGSTPSGAPFQAGTPCPWRGSTGKY